MKLSKIFLPIAFVGFIGLTIILWVLVVQGAFVIEPGEDADASAELATGIAAAFGAFFLIIFNAAVTLLFAGFGLGILICWICMFKGRNKFAALTGALVLLCLIFPTVLIAAIVTCVSFVANVPLSIVVAIFSLLGFLTSFVGVCVGYGKERALRKKEGAPIEEA